MEGFHQLFFPCKILSSLKFYYHFCESRLSWTPAVLMSLSLHGLLHGNRHVNQPSSVASQVLSAWSDGLFSSSLQKTSSSFTNRLGIHSMQNGATHATFSTTLDYIWEISSALGGSSELRVCVKSPPRPLLSDKDIIFPPGRFFLIQPLFTV